MHGPKLSIQLLHAMAACGLQHLSAPLGVHADISGRLWQHDSCNGIHVCVSCMHANALAAALDLTCLLQVNQRSSARTLKADALRLTHQANSLPTFPTFVIVSLPTTLLVAGRLQKPCAHMGSKGATDQLLLMGAQECLLAYRRRDEMLRRSCQLGGQADHPSPGHLTAAVAVDSHWGDAQLC